MTKHPLLDAVAAGDLKAVKRLLLAGHDVDERGRPLSAAELKRTQAAVAIAGLDVVGDLNRRHFDYTPLIAALGEGHFEVAKALLDAGADPGASDCLRRTPLSLAIGWKNGELAERLIATGAPPNEKDSDDDSLLTQAVRQQMWGVAHALLDAGANPAPTGVAGSSPMLAASEEEGASAEELILRLLDMGVRPEDPLIVANAIDKHSSTIVEKLSAAGATLQSKTAYGDPLLHAFQRADLDALRLLVKCGAKVVERKSDWGVLSYGAMSSADPDAVFACAELLLDEGANPNHSGVRGFSPLHACVRSNNPRFAAWLLARGAKPNPLFDGHKTPLDLTIEELDVAKRLGKLPSPWGPDQKEAAEGGHDTTEAKLRKLQQLLEAAGGTKGRQRVNRPDDNPVLDLPPSKRRGVCEVGFSKAYQVMVKGDIDVFSRMLQKDRKIDRVERDAYTRMATLQRPTGDLLSVVKLRGQPWLYVSGCRPHQDSPMQAWSRKARLPVLFAREESVSCTLSYALYDRGECLEAFESDGRWFRGGVEIDPDVHDESERMAGTEFSSQLRDPEEIDWAAYESEWDFVEEFLRGQDAYLTFVAAGFPGNELDPPQVHAYHPDEATSEQIERVDLIYYKPTEQQTRAAQSPKIDELYEAIREFDIDGVKSALAAGAKLNSPPPRHRTGYRGLAYRSGYLELALGGALHHHDHAIVDLLLAAGADPDFGADAPPLIYVTDRGGRVDDQVTLISKLIAAGADVNQPKPTAAEDEFAPFGHTALHVAASAGDPTCVKLLLRSGADPTRLDSDERTALQLARSRLKHVQKDRLRDEPGFTNEYDEPRASETVALLLAMERGDLDPTPLPTDAELMAAERKDTA